MPTLAEVLAGRDLSTLPADVLAEIDRLARVENANPLARYWLDTPKPPDEDGRINWGMAPWQRRFHQDQAKQRFIRAANEVGKTLALTAETWGTLTRSHPYRQDWPVNGPIRVLWVVADLDSAYADDVCSVIRELEPPNVLDPACSWNPVKGYIAHGKRGILLPDGSQVIFRSGTQEVLALSGAWAHKVIVNEPPKQSHWGETMRMANKHAAPIIAAATMIDATGISRDFTWLENIIEAEGSKWVQYVAMLRPEEVPFRTPENIAAQISKIPPWEMAQRRDGAWRGPAPDRILANFDDTCIFDGDLGAWDELPGVTEGAQLLVGLGADHGELGGNEVWLLVVWTGEGRHARAWVVDEYVSPDRTTVTQDALAVAALLGRNGLDLLSVDRAVGDTNSAGKRSHLQKLNQEFEQEFADIAGRSRQAPPFRVGNAVKGPGSVAQGVHVLNDALGSRDDGYPRLMVHRRCEGLVRSLQRWQGKGDEFKHWIDSARYLLVPILDPRDRTTRRIIRR